MRKERETILAETNKLSDIGLEAAPMHSPEFDCAAHLMYQLPTPQGARSFADTVPVVIASETGRNTYTMWEQVLAKKGAAHPEMNPYDHPANANCRLETRPDQCQGSIDILKRTIMVPMDPKRSEVEAMAVAKDITQTARSILDHLYSKRPELKAPSPIDLKKFDIIETVVK